MRRSELPPHKTATYVLPRWKVVYVSVPKAACTSLKWLLADLQGEDREQFYSVLSHETGRSMTVHRRSRWQHTPMLHTMTDAELEQISPDNGWFVFAVVRHPSARLWSGWQSKFLLREPRFVKLYPSAPWPRVPRTTSDVVEDFHAFARALDLEPPAPVFADRHFMPQTRLLAVDRTPYSRIYQTSEIPRLLDDLEKHLRPMGLTEMPALERSNEMPLFPVPALFGHEVEDIIGRHYAADFERFGYDEVTPPGLAKSGEYTSAELSEIGRLVDRAERVGDLVEIANGWKSRQAETAARLTELRKKQRRTAQQLARLRKRPGASVTPARSPRAPWARRAAGAVRRLAGR